MKCIFLSFLVLVSLSCKVERPQQLVPGWQFLGDDRGVKEEYKDGYNVKVASHQKLRP
jgi:hypothetical protein